MTLTAPAAPLDNLVRSLSEPARLRAGDGDEGRTLYGHFAVFNRWTEIDSWLEGRFLERIAPGAFNRTITESRDRVKVLYDHGKDPSLGNRTLGKITDLREDKTGAYYEVRIHDGLEAEYPLLMDGLRSGDYGASFRFRIVAEDRVEPLRSTKDNPERLMERTITDVDLYEFGPVTFPAYASATAGVRSATDQFFEALRDPLFVVRLTERVGPSIVERLIQTAVQPTASRNNDLVEELLDEVGPEDVDPPTEVDEDTPEAPDDVEATDEGDRAADGPNTATRTTTYAERQQMARLIQAQQMGLGRYSK